MTLHTVIVATSFKGQRAVDAVARLRIGDEVELYREAENRHDPNAVMVSAFDHACGYIPRVCNAELARAMDEGLEASAIVTAPAVVDGGRVITEPKIEVTW